MQLNSTRASSSLTAKPTDGNWNRSRVFLFVSRLEHDFWLRQALFACATFLVLLLVGYYYGTFDQAIHIPFLKAWSDPSLYPTDPFLALRNNVYSFFWFFFIPFYRLGVLEPTLFVVYLVSLYLTFSATWGLAWALFEDSLSATFAVLAMIFPHLTMIGFPTIEFSLLNRTFVLPFTLMAITLFVRGRKVQSFLLLGVLYNLHVLTVNFTLILLLMVTLRDLIRSGWKGWKTVAAQMAVFIVAALPVLVWRFGKERLDLSIRPDWVYAVGIGMLHHLYFLFSPQPYILLVNLGGVAAVALFLIADRFYPSRRHASTLRWMAAGALLVLLVQFIAAYWLPVTFIMQLQIARISTLLLILCLLYFAHFLAQLWRAGKTGEGSFGMMAGTFFLTASAIFPLLAWLVSAKKPLSRKASTPSQPAAFRSIPRWLAVGSTLLGMAICIVIGVHYDMWRPGIHIYPASTPWLQAQLWARNNTPKAAVFITPPQLWNVYDPDWRVFSERGDVATITDLLEVALDPQYFDTWLPRFKALAPGAYDQFNGDLFHFKKVIAQAYYSLSEGDILIAACQYHADYLVFEKPNQRNFPIIYQNDGYVIYDLSSVNSCGVAAIPRN